MTKRPFLTQWLGMLVFLSLTLSGCSFLFVRSPSDDYVRSGQFECTTSTGWPTFDAIYGTINTASNIYMANRGGSNQNAFVLGAIGSIILWGSSAIVGVKRVDECRKAKQLEDAKEDAALNTMPQLYALRSAPFTLTLNLREPGFSPRLVEPGPRFDDQSLADNGSADTGQNPVP